MITCCRLCSRGWGCWWWKWALLLGFGVLVFRRAGARLLFALAALCVLGSLSFCALGLLIASRVRTIEARLRHDERDHDAHVDLSPGCSFRRSDFRMSCSLWALPLTALIDALRANMLQGGGLGRVAPQMGVLAAWLVVCFALALKLFRWK